MVFIFAEHLNYYFILGKILGVKIVGEFSQTKIAVKTFISRVSTESHLGVRL